MIRSKILILLFVFCTPFQFLLYSIDSLQGVIIPSVEAGTYSNDIELSFNLKSGIDIYYSFKGSQDLTSVKYLFPLSLTAMPGELHKYNLLVTAVDDNKILESKEFIYIIDKDIPRNTTLNFRDGIYDKTLKLKFIPGDNDIYYSIESDIKNKYHLWQGETIEIPQKNNLNTAYIRSYCKDSAGNTSSVSVNRFSILPTPEREKNIEVLSPVKGTFLNSQLLYIDTAGYKWVRYSLNNADPELKGTTYNTPILFKTIGSYKLKIAALQVDSDTILRKNISFSITDNKNIIINKESGVYKEDINLNFDKNRMHYNLADKIVGPIDPLLPDSLSFMPVPGVVKYRVLRIADPTTAAGEYRYFFVLDKRIPAAPIISQSSDSPISSDTEVRIIAVPGANIFYTIDGSTPDRYSAYYNKPFKMKIPKGISTGSLIIKAIAYFSDKSTSQVTSKLIVFDTRKPEKPVLSIISQEAERTSFKISNIASNRFVYTVTYDGTEPPEPDRDSYTGKTNMMLSVPHGIQQRVFIKAALVDRAGNISDSVTLDLMDIDTVPPKKPVINIQDGILNIKGNDKVFYKISGTTNSSEYQLYKSPVSLEMGDNDLTDLVITSYCEDDKGNKSDIVTSKEIKIDNRTPVMPEYSGIKDGGIYNNPRSLRFFSSDDINVYYTIGLGSVVPEDPVPSESNVINDFLYFECPVNESRKYTVKLVSSYGLNKVTSQIKTLSFSIDRIAPRAPVISTITEGKIYNRDIKISVDDKENNVWLLIKDKIEDEDLLLSNFEMNGILLNTDYTLKQPDNSEKHYQVAALAIDEAGNTTISRDILSFSIDKIPPEPPRITIDSSAEGGFTIRMISDDAILYEINKNGIYPRVPDITSNYYDLPLEIQNINGPDIYISARTIDKAGNLSRISTMRKIVLRANSIEIPIITIEKLSSTESSVSFASITGERIFMKEGDAEFLEYSTPFIFDLRNRDYADLFYYSVDNFGHKSSVAVSRIEKNSSSGNIISGISNNKVYNSGRVVWKVNQSRTVRYEVAIDGNLPNKVTVFSPELIEPIVFDSAEGETLKVSINVKEFPNNASIIDKHDTNINFTIDKTKPSTPIVQGVENGGYYQEKRTIELKSKDTVFYKISTSTNKLPDLNFKKYKQAINIDINEGESSDFLIESYSEDLGGNRSPVNKVKFSIDKANIYVSLRGKDSNNGSRLKPFKTLQRAFEFTNYTKRNRINLTEGEFLLDTSLLLKKDVTILGGYSIKDWTSGIGETQIGISKRFSMNTPMIEMQSGRVVLKKLTISNSDLYAPIIKMSGGALLLDNVKLLHENAGTPVLIKLDNSEFTFKESELDFTSVKNGNLIDSGNSTIDINNSSIKASIKNSGISNIMRIFTLKNTNTLISNSIILPSIAQKIEVVNAADSKIDINSTNFDTGSGEINSDIFILKNCKFSLKDSEIGSVTTSRILSCFNVEDSTISISASKFNLTASSGISFVRSKNSSFELSHSDINAEKTNEFTYLFNCRSSIINLEGNVVHTKTTDILRGFKLDSSVSVFRDNLLYFDGSTTVFSVFDITSLLSFDFVSNKIYSSNLSWISSEDQAAFKITGGKDNVVFKDNDIYGWKSILDYNGDFVKTTDELNDFRGFLDVPEGNYSKKE